MMKTRQALSDARRRRVGALSGGKKLRIANFQKGTVRIAVVRGAPSVRRRKFKGTADRWNGELWKSIANTKRRLLKESRQVSGTWKLVTEASRS